jgi:hypothetical protein
MRIFLGLTLLAQDSVYRHSYEDVLERILWETLQHGLEPLRAVVEEELRRLEAD